VRSKPAAAATSAELNRAPVSLVEVEVGGDHERGPVFALFTASDRIEVNEPHVARFNRCPTH